ncbi:hypothetical protein PIB30_023710 [Stylosanthes scabra]|uniref:Ubiquitin-like protease family profile domain-containing protein n=1 Tax=Stylosanthes scabra TaxID=79078 RepID=A0ABU6UCD7_9FABA|nr:hypothetical protein [Stylosanthes scabra]
MSCVIVSDREVLFQAERTQGDRETLWSLRPKQEVIEDVLNLVPLNMKVDGDGTASWLPPAFAQIAFNPLNHRTEMLDFITSRYMGYADELKKALKLQNLLKDRDFYREKERNPPLDGNFHICEPLVTQQRDHSRDCGVYVAQ